MKGRFHPQMIDVPVQRFPTLDNLVIVQHGFTLRVRKLAPGIAFVLPFGSYPETKGL
jgi:hypothetical protein